MHQHNEDQSQELFDLKRHEYDISGASRQDRIIGGPFYTHLSKRELEDGFRLKVRIRAEVKDYSKTNIFQRIIGNSFTSRNVIKSRYYYITCRYDENGEWTRSVKHIDGDDSGAAAHGRCENSAHADRADAKDGNG